MADLPPPNPTPDDNEAPAVAAAQAAAAAAAPAAAADLPAAAAAAAHLVPAANQAVAAPAASRRGQGSRTNRRNYTPNELNQLFDIVDELLPISGAEWEQVELRHGQAFSDLGRTSDQLRKKFHGLARTSVPTGDPNIPPEVRRAKSIRSRIIQKSEGSTGSPNEGFDFAADDGSLPEDDALGAMFGGDARDASAANRQGGGDGGAAPPAAARGANAAAAAAESNAIPPAYVPNFRLGRLLDRVPFNPDNNDPDLQEEPTSATRRRSNPTPITRRNQRARTDDGPSFNQVMMLMMQQQQAEQRERQAERDEAQRERQADREEAREERRLRAQEQQMQQNMMQSMMMLMMQQMHPPAPAPAGNTMMPPPAAPLVMPPPEPEDIDDE